MMDLAQFGFGIITHEYSTGPANFLEEFLVPRVKSLYFIGHPFDYASDVRSHYRMYKDGRLVRENHARAWRLPGILWYCKDALFTLLWGTRLPTVDVIVAVDNLNASCALLLRCLGKARSVIYYQIDYVHQRFDNPLLNALYHTLDKLCVRACDKTWNLSARMAEEREKAGLPSRFRTKQIVVPIGTFPIMGASDTEWDPHNIAFVGHLRPGTGLETLLDAMPMVVRHIPTASLQVIGGGMLEDKLRAQVRSLGIQGHVVFTGFVSNHRDVEQLLLRSAVGVAPYPDDPLLFTQFTDPGKPKLYLSVGLPVVITRTIPFASEIEAHGCGLGVTYDKEAIAQALVFLLSDTERLRQFRARVLAYADELRWDRVFSDALCASNLSVFNHSGLVQVVPQQKK